MIGTAFWYVATDQWRYDGLPADALATPLGTGMFAGRTTADCLVESAQRGWMPSYPTFDRNPWTSSTRPPRPGSSPRTTWSTSSARAAALRGRGARRPGELPRCITVWRANILGSSGKGNEYFLKHLLGTDSAVLADESDPERRPQSIDWAEEAPRGKLDLLTTLDFRMTSTTLFSDVVLPAATWYEKHDLSTTDMHPFVHSFNPAISPPWQTRTDFNIFHTIAKKISVYSIEHLRPQGPGGRAAAARHPGRDVRAARDDRRLGRGHGRAPLVPGVTMPKLLVVERDYPPSRTAWPRSAR
ncbi:molybdopterin-dependent oxidoreductase [Oerskovia sp. M15]